MPLNSANERIKREYFSILKEVRQLGEASVDAAAKALDRFEAHTGYKDFKTFNREQARGFKQELAKQLATQSGEPLSKGTVLSSLNALKAFLGWLAVHPGYKRKIDLGDVGFLNLSLRDTAIARARREPRVPTIDQIRSVVHAMPDGTAIEKRDKAIIAFTIVTGARDNATASMRLKHIDTDEREIFQDARDVRTKFGKSFPTFFFNVGADLQDIVIRWVLYLKLDLGFGPEDPLFPSTKVDRGTDGNFVPTGLTRDCWRTAAPIRAVFKQAFARQSLPNFNPHSFRKTLVLLALDLDLDEATMKSWSQNLGHENIRTTLMSYGEVPLHRQRILIRAAGNDDEDERLALKLARELVAKMRAVA